ncbi:VPLPA-CTERM sorting domain-containing protein [Desulfovibrio mangrovi]|uniref:VPLPA-CTERM sorting domain-containing protein n=1 Tax=Desulfovibrio mangrovi TaxID=2976983 RepID=UPI002245E862|nr:VPLPA-CTERM sorting domain-containing protein [Desulfovibrio mangrovi]UZP67603.1 VPLPA-CTERM sorting domain-containing protein [Desulfovibrio mangrovi]
MKQICRIVVVTALAVFASGLAYAEYSVSDTYNMLFGTNYSNYDLFRSGRMTKPASEWTLGDMNTLQVMVMDTASTADLFLSINGGEKKMFFDNDVWTPPTRGYAIGSPIDLAKSFGITPDDHFSFYVGDTLISRCNTRMFFAPDPLQGFLLGFNDNGRWKAGDGDMNEPILYAKVNPTPIPGALWLLGTGVLGLVGVRRFSHQ